MDSIDKKLEEMLQRSETPIGDDGFTESVLRSLPRRKLGIERSRRWTLVGSAVMGSFLTLLLARPVETAFRLFEISGSYMTMIFAALLSIIFLFIPVAWFLYSQLEREFKMPDLPHVLFRSRMLRL